MTTSLQVGSFFPRAFIFDFDGTLADSMDVWAQVDRQFLDNHNLPDDDDYNEMIVALGFQAGAEWVVEHFDIGMTADEVVAEWVSLSEQFYKTSVILKPFAKEYLELVRSCGYPMAIATSLRRELLEAALVRLGIFAYFDELCICDELASAGKLEPTVYVEAAHRLSAKAGAPLALSDCVVFEDIASAAQTARTAGAYSVGVHSNDDFSTREALDAACDMVISSFEELL